MSQEIKKKIDELRGEIIHHDKLYAAERPVITDTEYDMLYNRLVDLEQKYPEYKSEDSPTQRIYTFVRKGLMEVKHRNKLLSLEKATDREGLVSFTNRFPNCSFKTDDKEDGLTIGLTYIDGLFLQGVTRGDGTVGEDVTHAIHVLPSVPKVIDAKGLVEIRAEAIIPFEDFERINADLIREGKEPYASPRNLASGSIRSFEAKVALERGVQLRAYQIVENGTSTAMGDMEQLRKWGFTVSTTKLFQSDEIEELIEYCLTYAEEKRPHIDHLIDGLVITVNEKEEHIRAGSTNKHPKYAIAFKFDSMDATTKMLDTVWTVGKTGQLTPNAVLEPVTIAGATIRRASLANISNIQKRDIRVGDTVVVARANDVIPQVTSAVKELRTGNEVEIQEPTECPVCGGHVERTIGKDKHGDESISLYCVSNSCQAQVERVLQYFVSRPAMDIDGLGEKTVTMLYQKGFVNGITDIFKLHSRAEEIAGLSGMGKGSVEKMLKGIEQTKGTPLSRVMSSLGVRNIGKNVSKILADKYHSWEHIVRAYAADTLHDEVIELDGISHVLAGEIVNFVGNEDVRETMQFLLWEGYCVDEPIEEPSEVEPSLDGLSFVITGKLSESRDNIAKRIKSLGGKVSGSVSAKTSYLVLGGYNDETGEFEGGKMSSKHKNALDLQEKGSEIQIISENKLKELM